MSQPPLETRSKTEAVAEYLRGKIRNGEFQPGEHLLQEILAEELGVSATPIREALRSLEAEGLVRYEPYKGVTVRGADPEQLRHIAQLRMLVEGYATRVAAEHLTPDRLSLLQTIHQEMESLVGTGDLETFSLASEEWHLSLYRACDIPLLPEIIGRLWAAFPHDTICLIPSRPQGCLAEHEKILGALVDGDPELAEREMVAHIESAERSVLEYLKQSREEQTPTDDGTTA